MPRGHGSTGSLSLRGISDLERGVCRAPPRGTVLRLAEALGLEDEEAASLLTMARRGRTAMDATAPARLGQHLPLAHSSLVGRERDIPDVGEHLERAG